ncbi:hypothetical protein PA10_00102 [Pseudomonas phage pPa_SNUABM_DT01]|nr:hypothetical protein PA10_00102 [Pseudomonas phage pPa_SNUABM_DT01]
MAFLETLKQLGQVVVEGVKNHPIAAAGIGVGTVATIGGVSYYRHRKGKKLAEAAMTTLGYDKNNPAQPLAEPAVAAAEAAPAPTEPAPQQ